MPGKIIKLFYSLALFCHVLIIPVILFAQVAALHAISSSNILHSTLFLLVYIWFLVVALISERHHERSTSNRKHIIYDGVFSVFLSSRSGWMDPLLRCSMRRFRRWTMGPSSETWLSPLIFTTSMSCRRPRSEKRTQTPTLRIHTRAHTIFCILDHLEHGVKLQ